MKKRPLLKSSLSLVCLLVMAATQFIVVPASVRDGGKDSLGLPNVVFNNGPLSTGATSKSGVAAPGGFTWSELSTDNGGGNFSNTTLGAGCQQITSPVANNRCADDFVVPAGQTWTLSGLAVYAYQTNSTSNPFTAANYRIWNGRPGDPGATVVFGDTTTNRLGTVTDTTWFRIGNTMGGAGGVTAAATNTARKIWRISLAMSPSLNLTAGTYWLDFQLNGGANGNFTPLISIPGSRATPLANGRQFIGTTSTWGDIVDIGEPAALAPAPQLDVVPNVPVEFPFQLEGAVSGGTTPPTSRYIDFDGDNKTDYSVVRAGAVTDPTLWITRNSGGTETYIPWGTGVGHSLGDKATPGDFDGDGKTDLAVWRPGAAGAASFYILQSSNGAFRAEAFGQTGDDPAVLGDYDGDGKDDPAVYRAGAQSFFYYRGSLSNPGGAVTFQPWGTTGDIPMAGDYDGDGRTDFSVSRASGGSFTHYQLRSTAGFNAVPWGLSTDKLVSGDFDGDLRSDIAVVRATSGAWNWFVLASSSQSLIAVPWGSSATDFLTPGDYDGDNRTDYAVWRSGGGPSDTNFFVRGTLSAPARFEWGQSVISGTAPDYPTANFAVK